MIFATKMFHRWIAVPVLGAMFACASEPAPTSPATEVLMARATAPPPNATLTWFLPDTGEFGVRGDGLAAYADTLGYTRYRDKECVSLATLYVGGSGDATMQNANPRYSEKSCLAYPRKVFFTLYNADPTTGALTASGLGAPNPAFLNVFAVHSVGRIMKIGGPWELHESGSNDGGRCGRLAFRMTLGDGSTVGGDLLMVRRTRDDTWEVQSQPNTVVSGNVVRHDKAWCGNENRLYSVPVRYIIKSASPLPDA